MVVLGGGIDEATPWVAPHVVTDATELAGLTRRRFGVPAARPTSEESWKNVRTTVRSLTA